MLNGSALRKVVAQRKPHIFCALVYQHMLKQGREFQVKARFVLEVVV